MRKANRNEKVAKYFIKLSLIVFILGVFFEGNIDNVSALDFDLEEYMNVGDTYDINYDEWLEPYTYLSCELVKGDIISVNNNLIVTALKPGVEYMTVHFKDENGSYDKWVCINSDVDVNDADSISNYSFILLHEMGHAVGSKHHYHEGTTCGNNAYCSRCAEYGKRRDIACVMNYYDYNTQEPFCSDCKREILIHLYTHHVQYTNILN